MENSQFVTDTELRRYINRGYAELYDLIITEANSDDYFLNSYAFNLTSGTKAYALPSDFYKMRGLDMTVGSDVLPIRRYNFSQRNVGSRYSVARNLRYHLQGNQIYLNPKPSTSDTMTLWYIPTPKKFLEVTPSAISRGSTTTWTVPSGHGFVADDTITGVNFLAPIITWIRPSAQSRPPQSSRILTAAHFPIRPVTEKLKHVWIFSQAGMNL